MGSESDDILDFGQQRLGLDLEIEQGLWCADLHYKNGSFTPAARYDEIRSECKAGKIRKLGLKWFDGRVANDFLRGIQYCSTSAAIVGTLSDYKELCKSLYADLALVEKITSIGDCEPTEPIYSVIRGMMTRACSGQSDSSKVFITIASAIHHIDAPPDSKLVRLSGPTAKRSGMIVPPELPYYGLCNLPPFLLTGSRADLRLPQIDRETETVYWHPDVGIAVLTQGGRGLDEPTNSRMKKIQHGHALSVQQTDCVKINNRTVMRKTVILWVGVIDEEKNEVFMLDNYMKPTKDGLRLGVIGMNKYNKIGLHRVMQPDIWAAFAAAEKIDESLNRLSLSGGSETALSESEGENGAGKFQSQWYPFLPTERSGAESDFETCRKILTKELKNWITIADRLPANSKLLACVEAFYRKVEDGARHHAELLSTNWKLEYGKDRAALKLRIQRFINAIENVRRPRVSDDNYNQMIDIFFKLADTLYDFRNDNGLV